MSDKDTPSRSLQRRLAAQKGEPPPRFFAASKLTDAELLNVKEALVDALRAMLRHGTLEPSDALALRMEHSIRALQRVVR